MPLSRLFPRRVDTDVLAARCAAADRLVERHAAALAVAIDRYLAEPGNPHVREALEAAEERSSLAEWSQRRARRDLNRARRREHIALMFRRLGTLR